MWGILPPRGLSLNSSADLAVEGSRLAVAHFFSVSSCLQVVCGITYREDLPDSLTHSWYSSGKVSVNERKDSASGLESPSCRSIGAIV